MRYIPIILFGLTAFIGLGTYALCKFLRWSARFAQVRWSKLRVTIFCVNCGESIHGCFHRGGVPSTWEHSYGSTQCRNPYDPEKATAWHA